MSRVYILLIVFGLLGGVGFGAYKYYTDTQQRIQTLAENNAKLEVALETSESSINALQAQAQQTAKLTNELQVKLQKAEAYGDNLRNRLRQLDLLADAVADPKNLEGRMNGATANLWREFMAESGNSNDVPLPSWLQRPETGDGDQSSDEDQSTDDPNGITTETNSTE
jgi:hypothetical protein